MKSWAESGVACARRRQPPRLILLLSHIASRSVQTTKIKTIKQEQVKWPGFVPFLWKKPTRRFAA
jgi:hypothetical protein